MKCSSVVSYYLFLKYSWASGSKLASNFLFVNYNFELLSPLLLCAGVVDVDHISRAFFLFLSWHFVVIVF